MAVLLGSLFVVMVGYGSTVAVFPGHVQRAGGLADAADGAVAFHVGLIVGVYALAGLLASPVAGRLGDRLGRRPVLLVGLGASAVAQVLFALAGSLWTLYVVRFVGGLADASVLVAGAAYVADSTGEQQRARGMAWFGTAIGLGLVVGPAITPPLSSSSTALGHLAHVDAQSVPFLFSGLAAAGVLIVVGAFLPESPRHTSQRGDHARQAGGLGSVLPTLRPLLLLVLAAQYGMTVFEAMFVLYARTRLSLSLGELSLVFIACNATVAGLQLPAVEWLTGRVSSLGQVALGFAVMGASLVGLVPVRSFALVLVVSGAHGAGAALIIPNVAALVSSRATAGAGLALGLKNSASGLGQVVGPLMGGSLMGLRSDLPFLLAGGLLVALAIAVRAGFASSRQRPSVAAVARRRFGDLPGTIPVGASLVASRYLVPATTPFDVSRDPPGLPPADAAEELLVLAS
jgi:DHA1 family multidrug resistance protein-like MFS transporter